MLDRLEKRFRRFAIPGLINYVCVFNVLFYVAVYFQPSDEARARAIERLSISWDGLMSGQVWRLFTHFLTPQTMNPLWFLIFIMLLLLYGRGLEAAWGTFRFNAFFFMGAFVLTVMSVGISFFVGIVPAGIACMMIDAQLFLAFATIYPDYELHLFFILPIKVKWLAMLMAGYIGFMFLVGNFLIKLAVLAAFSNYILFFGPGLIQSFRYRARRRAYQAKIEAPLAEAFHRCAACGQTERDDPSLEFRVWDDGSEYCMTHLKELMNPVSQAGEDAVER